MAASTSSRRSKSVAFFTAGRLSGCCCTTAATGAALHHGAYCLGCCWALMLLFVAFGAMNIAAMVGLAAVVFSEKVSPRGDRLSHVFGIACLMLAGAVLIWPGIAPGLTSMPEMMG